METVLNQKYSCVILDDDFISVKILESHIEDLEHMSLVGAFYDPIEATAAFQGYDEIIDFLFLDIGMEISGLDIARMLREKVRFIVFITAYKDFALEAFEHGDSYLVKPVTLATLAKTIAQLIKRHPKQIKISSEED